MTVARRRTLTNIQILRGFAAASVALAHAANQFPEVGSIPRIDAAQAGVDVFFVISGFIMVYVTSTRPQTSSQFLLNRASRIVPNYWFYTLATAALAIAAPAVFRGTSFNLPHLILSLFFVAHPNPALDDSVSPLLRVGWTLNYEMFFYLIFAIGLLRPQSKVTTSVGIIISLVFLGFLLPDPGPVTRFYTRDIMLEFVFGMLLAIAYLRGLPKLPVSLILAACAGAVFFMILSDDVAENTHAVRSIFFGLPALVIVACALMLPDHDDGFGHVILTRIGDASYTIYLCHPFILTLCRVVAVRLGLQPMSLLGNITFMLGATAAATGIGYLAYLFIEVPIGRSTKRLFIQPRLRAVDP
ncbi:acyltransferase family protein [Beijerinckia indica]|uniref:Acyltransferase 3 n=1 Tax=Beijerinckia indica subsp. indica (strain ATCC 9039 / DSM 1715 / NCIMB 8712) TaxID=395963 RepID=B2ILL0_BEII9|nr:acyltransferase family protein [Beijerinckia indica]ACB97410.1 acyltransferase 3 [Beijerinckia indica subsp. indica ATCC 9039]